MLWAASAFALSLLDGLSFKFIIDFTYLFSTNNLLYQRLPDFCVSRFLRKQLMEWLAVANHASSVGKQVFVLTTLDILARISREQTTN